MMMLPRIYDITCMVVKTEDSRVRMPESSASPAVYQQCDLLRDCFMPQCSHL